MKNYAVILAAGRGSRMKTELPKCAYPILRKPMIEYIIDAVEKTKSVDEIICVIGHKKEVFETLLFNRVSMAYQDEILGTGSAAKSALPLILDSDGYTLIIPGDKPLISSDVLISLIEEHQAKQNDITFISTYIPYPNKFGKVIRDDNNLVKEIIEEKNANRYVKLINEVNTSVYCISNKIIHHLIDQIKFIPEINEYHLTDIIKIARDENYKVGTLNTTDYKLFQGINDLYDLSLVESTIRMEINKSFMKNGICIINPETVTIGDEVQIEPGTIINPNTYLTGQTIIKGGCCIGPNTEIHNSIIGEETVVKHSLVYDSKIGSSCTVGPFAHLRNNTELGNNMRVGNFVEFKNSHVDDGTKVSHLTYVGDSDVGKNVNFGCGVITVNYDGKNKYRTTIGDNVFIGCNTNLIAPVIVDDNAFIAAGSTITTNVPKDAMSIARSYQVTKEGYASKYPYAKKFIKDNDK